MSGFDTHSQIHMHARARTHTHNGCRYWLLGSALGIMTPFLACLAFVLKIRTVAPVAAVHYTTWSFEDWLVLFGFANQVASLQQDVTTVEKQQTLHFAFAGVDGLMQKDEIRRRDNFPKFMSRVLIGAKVITRATLAQTRIRAHACSTRESLCPKVKSATVACFRTAVCESLSFWCGRESRRV